MDTPDEPFDAAAYARRLGLATMPPASVDGVRHLVHAHALAIPFENLDAVLGRGVDLAPEAVFRKLVASGRGGWCFEQNLLLGLALRSMGIRFVDLAGQVIWFRPPGFRAPRTHRLLLVELEGRRWLADVGFGAVTMTNLVALEPDVEQPTPHETLRLAKESETVWRLEVRLAAGWQPTYRFDLNPWWPDDFGPVNYQLSRDPESPFVKAVNVALPVEGGRVSLRDAELTRWGLDGSRQVRRLRDVPEMLDVLEGTFGLAVRSLPGIRERLAACFVPSPGAL